MERSGMNQIDRLVRVPNAELKAFHVFAGEPHECPLLIFTTTANKARKMACSYGLWEYGSYVETKARRAKNWDAWADAERVIEQNSDLPEGAEPFYCDDECAL